MAIAANQMGAGDPDATHTLVQRLEGLLTTYLPELKTDIALTGETGVPADKPLAGMSWTMSWLASSRGIRGRIGGRWFPCGASGICAPCGRPW